MNRLFGNSSISVTVSSYFLLVAALSAQPAHSNCFEEAMYDCFLIDTTLTYTHAPGRQRDPAVAFDGTNFLVVWPDGRDIYNIFGTRVNQSGTVVDSAGIIITGAVSSEHAALTFDGTNYLLVWRNRQTDPGFGDIYGTRISSSGAVLDSNGIPIATDPSTQMSPAVATSLTNYLVVWHDIRDGLGICGARVSHSGILIDTTYIVISGIGSYPSVSFDGVNYLVAWHDWYDIYGARISQSGVLLDSVAIPISVGQGNQRLPSVAFDGTNYLVEWEDMRNGEEDIYGSRVTPAGIVLDPGGIAISTAPGLQRRSSVAFDGTNYLVVWDDYRDHPPDIYCARVTPTGTVLDPQGILISETEGYQWSPSVVFGDTSYLVVWEESRSGYDVYGVRVAPSGTVLDTTAVCMSTSANYQKYSSIASNGTDYIVVWQDMRSGSHYDIYGIRVDSAGQPLDSMPIAISATQDDQFSPAITYGNTHYLAVWIDMHNGWRITGKRISTAGTILDTNIVICAQGSSPCVAFDGTNYFVVWDANVISGKRVSEAGVLIDTVAIPISGGPWWNAFYPAVTFGAPHYFVVWKEQILPDEYWLYGTRVAINGIVVDTTSILISTLCDDLYKPTTAFDGANYLVVWEYNYYICGARISQSGTVIDSPSVYIGQGYPSALAFDGSTYLLLTEELNGSWDVHGLIIDTSLTVVDSFVVCAQPGLQLNPALALDGGNRFLVTYSGWTDSINVHPANTTRIWGRLYPFVGREEQREFGITPVGLNLRIYPNPFSNVVNIQYYTQTRIDNIKSKIYDISGRLVKDLSAFSSDVDQQTSVTWDGTDQANRSLPSGIYFLQLKAGDSSITEKLLLIR